jgi:YbgC/YbaW family acyl-CoA thioester hydrolase
MLHVFETTVRFSDLDPYDHVNHARYLSYFESARIEMLDEIGHGMSAMKRAGVHIVLVELAARFHQPAGLHDRLTITTRVGEVGRTTSRWHQECRRAEELIATIDLKAAFTDLAGRPRRAPEGFVAAAARYR